MFMCVCVGVYVWVQVYVYVYMCVHMSVYEYVYVCVYVCVSVYVDVPKHESSCSRQCFVDQGGVLKGAHIGATNSLVSAI